MSREISLESSSSDFRTILQENEFYPWRRPHKLIITTWFSVQFQVLVIPLNIREGTSEWHTATSREQHVSVVRTDDIKLNIDAILPKIRSIYAFHDNKIANLQNWRMSHFLLIIQLCQVRNTKAWRSNSSPQYTALYTYICAIHRAEHTHTHGWLWATASVILHTTLELTNRAQILYLGFIYSHTTKINLVTGVQLVSVNALLC
jgi:hypothetical protein